MLDSLLFSHSIVSDNTWQRRNWKRTRDLFPTAPTQTAFREQVSRGLLEEVVESPSLEVFKTQLDKVPVDLVWIQLWACSDQRDSEMQNVWYRQFQYSIPGSQP